MAQVTIDDATLDSVIYERTVNGREFRFTLRDVIERTNVLPAIASHGIHRIAGSARNGGEDANAKDAAEAARLDDISADRMWQQGGGNALDERTRLYREHLIAWATTYANVKRSDAKSRVAKDGTAILTETATAILRKQGEKQVGKQRAAEAAENLRKRILQDVDKAMEAQSISI
jgi:hypothetical protein